MPLQLTIENSSIIADLLWENLVSGPSILNSHIRLVWLLIYRSFYFYWAPVSSIRNKFFNENSIENYFKLDEVWLQDF